MKAWIIVGCLGVVILIGAVVQQETSSVPSEQEIRPGLPLDVETLMRNVDRHRRGVLAVQGVVSATDTASQMLTLIDVAEFEECGVVNCASLTLPVRWSGQMPQTESLVRLNGKVREQDGRLVFVAETLRQTKPASGVTE